MSDFEAHVRDLFRRGADVDTRVPHALAWGTIDRLARRRRTSRRVGTSVGVAGLALAGGITLAWASPLLSPDVASTTGPSSTSPAVSQDPVASAQCMRDLGAQDDGYTSVAVDMETASAIVYRVGGDTSEAAEHYATCRAAGVLLEIRSSILTFAQGDTLRDMIEEAMPRLEAEGIRITRHGLRPTGYLVGFESADAPGVDQVIEEFSIFGEGTVFPDFDPIEPVPAAGG